MDTVAPNALALYEVPGLDTSHQISIAQTVLIFFKSHAATSSFMSWGCIGALWMWRGRVRRRWTQLGFNRDSFKLLVRMRGGETRLRMLKSLSLPKDRNQLASELGMDWKGIDRHTKILSKYGLLEKEAAYGKVVMFKLTTAGRSLVQLLEELEQEI